MKLKRLTLQGYKTFASRTNFEFDEGITAVVGPNGCGKSNIADAIRWVLGEQSYSTLRGKRTTDMIFAGSQQRARAGMAQAILTLDNSEGWLPIDYSEIEIGRRAHRSGDNEYLLNGQKVRLRDITDLLAKSGLAQRTYTIIGQGLIDQALSLRADERRLLFEEAAGVSHYKQRRAETLRRLQETAHNLERVQDIIAEIRPRLNTLRRQANRARNHEQVAADLHHLLQLWYGYRWEQAKRCLREARQESKDARKIWVEARRGQLKLQERLDAERRELNKSQDQLRQLELDRDEIRDSFENVRREVAVLSERKALLKRQLDEQAGELPALEVQKESASGELEQAMADLKLAQDEMVQQQAELKSFEANFLTHQVEIDRWQQNVSKTQSEVRQTADALAQAKGRVAQIASQLRERMAEAGHELDLTAAEDETRSLESQVATKQDELAQIQGEITDQGREKQRITTALAESRSAIAEREAELATLDQQIVGLASQLEILNQPVADRINPPAGLPNLGQLADIIEIPDAYQKALRAALADRILTWILVDDRALWSLYDASGEGRLSAIARNEIAEYDRPQLPSERNVIGWADELVTAGKENIRLVRLLLGRILVVRDAMDAYRIAGSLPPGSLAVSSDGFVVHAGGLVELGAGKEGAAQLARLERRQSAMNDVARLRSVRTALAGEIAGAAEQLLKLEYEFERNNAEGAQLDEQQRNGASSLTQAQAVHRLALQRLEFGRSNALRTRQTIERLEQRISDGKATVAEYETSVARLSLTLEESQMRLEKLPVSESAEARRQLQQSTQSARTILAGRQAVVDSRQTTLRQLTDQLRRRQVRFEELQGRWLASELPAKEAELLALQEEMETLRQHLEPLRKRITESQAEATKLDGELSELQRGSHNSETRYTQARIDLTQQESLIESLQERIQTDLGLVALTYDDDQPAQSPLPMAEVVEELPVVDSLPEDIEESIRRSRGQLNRIGAVNPDAPVEYDETLTRHDFLVQQTGDLSATKERLREVIDDLDDLTSRAFAETVEKVNGVFGEVFKRLFGGGSAQLALTDPDDLTVTGVDILARLPRRREQGLALLSGGERSLTAAALIFALLKVSPTPFCVLDEVDAMLDEANVNRFRELLTELSEHTQFIVITHNRGTVQVAESVYGVSMGADSVSQVISIKPEDYIRQHS